MFWRECALLVICLSAATATPYADALQTYPKCCNEDEIIALATQNSSMECMELQSVPRATLLSQSREIKKFSFLECSEGDFCVDVTENGRMFKLSCNGTQEEVHPSKKFSKCCPLKHSYDPYLHTCVNDTREDAFFHRNLNYYVEIGLGACGIEEASRDVVVEFENLHLSKDGSLYLNSEGLNLTTHNFCIDRVAEPEQNRYVIRICESLEKVCKHGEEDKGKVRCLRKCCSDGEHFIERTCSRRFEKGINLTKFPFAGKNGK